MKNIKKTTLAITFLSLLTLGFTGCGSDSEDSTDNGGVTPSGSYDCESTQEYNGKTFTMKLSATGKLQCNDLYGYPELEFIDGVNEMVVSQLTSTETFDSDIGTGTTTVNLQEGTEHIVGSVPEYGSVDCVNTYDVPLPITFYSATDIQDFYIDDYQLVNSTCPSWVNDDLFDDQEPTRVSMSSEIVVTETSGDVSTVSSYLNY